MFGYDGWARFECGLAIPFYPDGSYMIISYAFRINLYNSMLRLLRLGNSNATPSLALQFFFVLLHALDERAFPPNLVSVSVEEYGDGYNGHLDQAQ